VFPGGGLPPLLAPEQRAREIERFVERNTRRPRAAKATRPAVVDVHEKISFAGLQPTAAGAAAHARARAKARVVAAWSKEENQSRIGMALT
jgi:hypothetical protein